MIAFVLCKLVAGLEQKAVQQIKNIRGVKDVYMTFGGWDAILVAESDTIDKLSGLMLLGLAIKVVLRSTTTPHGSLRPAPEHGSHENRIRREHLALSTHTATSG